MEGKQKINKEKAKFYFAEKLKAHISKLPTGIMNGCFDSDLIDEKYYWFIDDVDGKKRLFLSEIYEVNDFKEKQE